MINRVRDNITTFEQRSGNYKGKKYSILLFASLCITLHLQQDFDLRTTMAESLELWKMIKGWAPGSAVIFFISSHQLRSDAKIQNVDTFHGKAFQENDLSRECLN